MAAWDNVAMLCLDVSCLNNGSRCRFHWPPRIAGRVRMVEFNDLADRLRRKQMPQKRSSLKQKRSAGILAYRRREQCLEVLLVHPGGPFWRNKDEGAWSIPKGEIGGDEDAETAALREFAEELGPIGVGRPAAAARRGAPTGRKARHRFRWGGRLQPGDALEQHVRDPMAS
jgi:hypothetical protein